MKTADKREQFIILRAEGLSFSKISAQLGISKSTCSKWEKDAAEQIRRAKEERLTDLYTLYRIGREAHIEKLGETLKRIDAALEQKDLTEIPADKLLKLKLEYEERLQEQRTEQTAETETFKDYTGEELLRAAGDLYERIKTGKATPTQARTELKALEGVIRAISENNSIW